MTEMADAGEDHGNAAVVGGLDDFLIADGAAGLDGAGGAGLGGGDEAIGEWEKGVTGYDAAGEGKAGVLGLPDGDAGGVDARHLAGADAEGAVLRGIDDGV